MPPSDHDVQHFAPLAKHFEDRLQIEVFVFEDDVELIQDHHTVRRILDHAHGLRPAPSGCEHIGLPILRIPGVPRTYDVKIAVRLR